MDLHLRRINNQKVLPVITKVPRPDQIVGGEVLPKLFCNVFIAGRKGSGKTTSLFHILKECLGPQTTLVVFSNTHSNDPTWGIIKGWLASRGFATEFYSSIGTGKKGDPSHLDTLIDRFEAEGKEREKKKKASKAARKASKPSPNVLALIDAGFDEEQPIAPKERLKAPAYIIVFDDISAELRNGKAISRLLKQHRHYGCKVIVSTQDLTDIDPTSKNQMDFFLLYHGFGLERFQKHLYDTLDLGGQVSSEKLHSIYHAVTRGTPGAFMMIDKDGPRFRRDFDHQIDIPTHT